MYTMRDYTRVNFECTRGHSLSWNESVLSIPGPIPEFESTVVYMRISELG